MSRDGVAQMLTHVAATAAQDGLDYDFDAVITSQTLAANSSTSRRRRTTARTGRGTVQGLLRDGRTRGPARVAGRHRRAGRPGPRAGRWLRWPTTGAQDAVATDIDLARRIGVQGVPFYVLDGKFAGVGAQDPAVFPRGAVRGHEAQEATDD